MTNTFRALLWSTFVLLAAGSIYFTTQLKFSFNFEQFFPEGDEDLAFFRDFIKEFETDDNFLLVALRREQGAFDSTFLNQVHDFSLRARDLPHVVEVQSLTKFAYPVRTPFSITSIPAIHLDDPSRYDSDRKRLLADERFVRNLISEDGRTLVVFLKIINSIQLEEARELMGGMEKLISGYGFEEYHFLGRPYFQKELVRMQQREIIVSTLVSGLLVSLIMTLVFRRFWGIAVALFSLGLILLFFLGFLGAAGRELNAMSALYPVLMLIVGTADIIHIMVKYIDELRKGHTRALAIRITIREIGLATLLTAFTTAAGFASMVTNRIAPIRDFGINAAIGVMIAYLTVITLTTSLLVLFRADQLIRLKQGVTFWDKLMDRIYQFTLDKPKTILIGSGVLMVLCLVGISKVTTNYDISANLPIGEKITEDFRFFERELAGFRPLEIAVLAQGGRRADDFEVVREIGKVEDYLRNYPFVQGIGSVTAVYKSINQMYGNNAVSAYRLPEDEETFERYQRLAARIPQLNSGILVSRDGSKARITSRVLDVGADSMRRFDEGLGDWIAKNTDPTVVQFVRTGTALIIDKNTEYLRLNLLQGLGMSIAIVAALMALLFGTGRMLLIALVPNLLPMLIIGALMGFFGIELDAGMSIVFGVVFGIAVDDTIHVLSRLKLALMAGKTVEESLYLTFAETGKAMVLTTIFLFFGFMVLLFSIHPPSVAVGLLISVTLASALFCDLLILPLMVRWLIRDPEPAASAPQQAPAQAG